ncbi:hypothetical protein DPEC_G00302000 [Dallia pectoralis]|uniref:Uncharacterized protein n=1 Tax=Dallia pectoralis TaxID=75939 RepID=A0ACC2FGX3_DALPE|nr:hypothetical protein DPEC_G00302000 [Dallia pectoralis]
MVPLAQMVRVKRDILMRNNEVLVVMAENQRRGKSSNTQVHAGSRERGAAVLAERTRERRAAEWTDSHTTLQNPDTYSQATHQSVTMLCQSLNSMASTHTCHPPAFEENLTLTLSRLWV